jgi:hypothetical protein
MPDNLGRLQEKYNRIRKERYGKRQDLSTEEHNRIAHEANQELRREINAEGEDTAHRETGH